MDCSWPHSGNDLLCDVRWPNVLIVFTDRQHRDSRADAQVRRKVSRGASHRNSAMKEVNEAFAKLRHRAPRFRLVVLPSLTTPRSSLAVDVRTRLSSFASCPITIRGFDYESVAPYQSKPRIQNALRIANTLYVFEQWKPSTTKSRTAANLGRERSMSRITLLRGVGPEQ